MSRYKKCDIWQCMNNSNHSKLGPQRFCISCYVQWRNRKCLRCEKVFHNAVHQYCSIGCRRLHEMEEKKDLYFCRGCNKTSSRPFILFSNNKTVKWGLCSRVCLQSFTLGFVKDAVVQDLVKDPEIPSSVEDQYALFHKLMDMNAICSAQFWSRMYFALKHSVTSAMSKEKEKQEIEGVFPGS
jgi:hypothetical protein